MNWTHFICGFAMVVMTRFHESRVQRLEPWRVYRLVEGEVRAEPHKPLDRRREEFDEYVMDEVVERLSNEPYEHHQAHHNRYADRDAHHIAAEEVEERLIDL